MPMRYRRDPYSQMAIGVYEPPADSLDQIALIRKVVKRHVPGPVSVRNERGTAWGWVDITGPHRGMFRRDQMDALIRLGLERPGAGETNSTLISPENRKPTLRRWKAEGILE